MNNTSETTSNDELTRKDLLLLEGYRNLSAWNHHDGQAVLAFDKIFIPLSLGAPILTRLSEKAFEFRVPILIASIILLVAWFFLSMRYRDSQSIRFDLMRCIERKLNPNRDDFRPGEEYAERNPNRKWPKDRHIRQGFFFIALMYNCGLLIYELYKC